MTAATILVNAEDYFAMKRELEIYRDLATQHAADPLAGNPLRHQFRLRKAMRQAWDAALVEAATICNRSYGGSIGDVHKAILALRSTTATEIPSQRGGGTFVLLPALCLHTRGGPGCDGSPHACGADAQAVPISGAERHIYSNVGHSLSESSWHIHLAGFHTQKEAEATLAALLTITGEQDMMNDGTYLTSANWKHSKSGGCYHIVGISTREFDGVTLIHYRSARDPSAPTWTREASEFFDGRFVRMFPGMEDRA